MLESSKTKILVVDDDAQLLVDIKSQLEKLGYEVTTAVDSRNAMAAIAAHDFGLVLLDIYFAEKKPGGGAGVDGIEILRLVREAGNVPVIMLSSTNISTVKVMALTLGADDYISKPFDVQELAARIEAILRRCSETHSERALNFRRLRLDPGERRVWKDGCLIQLTAVEFDILHTLARRPEYVFTREKLIELAWKGESYSVAKAVDVHVGHIRKKIEDDPSQPAFIVTVRGTGYRFEDIPA